MSDKRTDNFISAPAADKLIAAHDGDVALLYVYMARTGCTDPEQAARDLCRTLREIAAAEEKLQRMGLLPGTAQGGAAEPAARPPQAPEALPLPAEPEERLPEYRTEDIVRRSKEDGAFAVIVDEAARVIGRSLSSSDMKLLFGVYDYLALPPEVILMLLNYCAELFHEKYGPGRRLTARAIEKEAYVWANREILTFEQAEEYIRLQRSRWGETGRVKAALGIQGRELSATEAKYIASWLDMGFREDAVAIAYDRTVTNTGGLKWGYLNKILQSWHEKGLHTRSEIEAKDGRRRAAAPKPSEPVKQIDLDAMRSFLGKK